MCHYWKLRGFANATCKVCIYVIRSSLHYFLSFFLRTAPHHALKIPPIHPPSLPRHLETLVCLFSLFLRRIRAKQASKPCPTVCFLSFGFELLMGRRSFRNMYSWVQKYVQVQEILSRKEKASCVLGVCDVNCIMNI